MAQTSLRIGVSKTKEAKIMEKLDIKSARQRTWRSVYQDGLLEIGLGIIFLLAAIPLMPFGVYSNRILSGQPRYVGEASSGVSSLNTFVEMS